MEYLSNPNQSRRQVQFLYYMLQAPAITIKSQEVTRDLFPSCV